MTKGYNVWPQLWVPCRQEAGEKFSPWLLQWIQENPLLKFILQNFVILDYISSGYLSSVLRKWEAPGRFIYVVHLVKTFDEQLRTAWHSSPLGFDPNLLYQLDLLVNIPHSKSAVWPRPLCDSVLSGLWLGCHIYLQSFHAPSHCVQGLHLLQIPAQMPTFSLKFHGGLQSAARALSLNGQHFIFTSKPSNHSSVMLSIVVSLVLLVYKPVPYASLCSSQPCRCLPHSRCAVGICCMFEMMSEDTLYAKLSGRHCRKYINKYNSISVQKICNLIGIYLNTNIENTSLLYIS